MKGGLHEPTGAEMTNRRRPLAQTSRPQSDTPCSGQGNHDAISLEPHVRLHFRRQPHRPPVGQLKLETRDRRTLEKR